MTPEELKAVKDRCESAHPGPWEIAKRRSNATRYHLGTNAYPDSLTKWAWQNMIACDFLEDAEFIAHARQDVPALLAEIEQLRADLASETAWAEEYQNQVNRLLDDCIMWQQKLAEAKTEIDRLKLERSE